MSEENRLIVSNNEVAIVTKTEKIVDALTLTEEVKKVIIIIIVYFIRHLPSKILNPCSRKNFYGF